MAVGFKTRAIKEQEARELEENKNSPSNAGEEMVGVAPVVAETYDRLENLSNFIMSKQFTELNADAKQIALSDFAYYSQVAATI